jgi:hypothetical protein
VKSASGPGGTGSQTNRSPAPPVRHHGPGAANADADLTVGRRSRVLATPIASAGSPALTRSSERFERGSSKRPRSPGSAYQCAARCSIRRPRLPSFRWRLGASRLARKHVSFRRLQKLDSERHGAAAAGERSPVAAARRVPRSKGRARRAVAKAELDQGNVSRHDARPADAPSPTRAIVAGVRLKWCGDELDPNKAEQVTWFVLSPVCSARGRLSRATHPLPRGSAERARHAR